MSTLQDLNQVLSRKQDILENAAGVEKQKKSGKLTARERVEKLADAGSFVELFALVSQNEEGAGVITGYGTVQDRPVYLFAQDFTVHGGAMGEMQAKKICKVLDLAQKTGAPVVAMLVAVVYVLSWGVLSLSRCICQGNENAGNK